MWPKANEYYGILILSSLENQDCCVSVQFSHSVLSDSLRPHGLQHARPPCPSPMPRVYSNSCPLSWWCHSTVSSSVVPFSSCPQSLPVSGSFQMSQLFTSGGQGIGVSASTSVLPMNIQDWFPLGLTLINLQYSALESWLNIQPRLLSLPLYSHGSQSVSFLWAIPCYEIICLVLSFTELYWGQRQGIFFSSVSYHVPHTQ